MRLCMTEEKILRRTLRENSSRGLGTTSMTSPSPSASISARRGLTTVVLPAPMIICFTNDLPDRRLDMNSRTSATCSLRNMMFHVNSNTRNRGSYVSGPSRATKCRPVSRAPARASAFWTIPASLGLGPSPASARSILTRSMHISMMRLMCPMRLAFSSIPVTRRMPVWNTSGLTNGFSLAQSSTARLDMRDEIKSSSHISVSCSLYRRKKNVYRFVSSSCSASAVSILNGNCT
mmetsp:Transcript_87073/g.144828  ORF Transcript_87073/g.144828 Transcript_87073/m.144828 type:complete len:234 (+) Transcript_87073:603-1304(+)